MATPITGDLTKGATFDTVAVGQPFTLVPQAELADAGSVANTNHLSGKVAGGAFVDEDFNIYVATGSAPTDPWHLSGAADDTSDITPA